jgi:hypothetical protein
MNPVSPDAEAARQANERAARRAIGRRITGVHYWDIHDFGQAPVVWDHADWHHAVMGVGLDTDRGPMSIACTNSFHAYGVELFEDRVPARLVLGEGGPRRVGPDGAMHHAIPLDVPITDVHITWWTDHVGPFRLADGTVVSEASSVDVPVALRLDFEPGPVWFVAGIPQAPAYESVFIGGDEIMVVLTAARALQLGLGIQ